MSNLAQHLLSYQPQVPPLLADLKRALFQPISETLSLLPEITRVFSKTAHRSRYRLVKGEGTSVPLKVGVLFSGGQAAGGHNVIWGLEEGLPSGSQLIGFLNGPQGLLDNASKPLSRTLIADYRNQGGFDLLGSGRTKVETEEQFSQAVKTAKQEALDGLVIIGGDDSNTNAAFLAERFAREGLPTRVLGVPKTIDGDLRSEDIELSFGFDSATKTYSEMIGNIARDAMSARKYVHFIKLMGRSASHVTLECALRCHPNLSLIGEEIQKNQHTLDSIVDTIASWIEERKKGGRPYGVVLIPEGLLEFIPEVSALIEEVSRNPTSRPPLLETFPEAIRKQLLAQRDPHGNVQLSQIQTEELLLELVRRKTSFHPVSHFLGYEGRSCLPTHFDATYGYVLGLLTAVALRQGLTGCIAAVRNLARPVSEWEGRMVPLTSLLAPTVRGGKEMLVIAKTRVDLKGKAFRAFSAERSKWANEDAYEMPGPIQFFGPPEVSEARPLSL